MSSKKRRPRRTLKVKKQTQRARRLAIAKNRPPHKKKKRSERSEFREFADAAITIGLIKLAHLFIEAVFPDGIPKKPAPKSHQIGREDPRDVVIDVKPEGIE